MVLFIALQSFLFLLLFYNYYKDIEQKPNVFDFNERNITAFIGVKDH